MGNMKPIDSAVVKNETYDVLSADTMGGEYIETIGAACQNPDGYTSGSLFLGKDNDVQHLYRATAAIAFGETIILDTNCVYTTVSGELEGKAEESEVTSLNEALTNEVSARAELGAHNLWMLKIANIKAANTNGSWTGNVYNYSGLEYTLDADTYGNLLSITIEGTNNAGGPLIFDLPISYTPSKDIILNGCPTGGGSNSYQLDANDGVLADQGNGVSITANTALTTSRIRTAKDYAYATGGVVFRPMIRIASDPSTDFTPYAMTNRELTDATETLRKNATNRYLYYNNSGTFVADSSVTLSDNDWTLVEILMYTNNTNSSSRTSILIYKNHIIPGPYLPIINNEDRTKMAYFRPTNYSNNVLSFQASCPVMIISVKPII